MSEQDFQALSQNEALMNYIRHESEYAEGLEQMKLQELFMQKIEDDPRKI